MRDDFFDRFKQPDTTEEKEVTVLETEVKDSLGETINDEDGVFELTFIHNDYCEFTGVFESGETCLIVTQMNIVDAIEEYGADLLKHIEFVGSGTYYKKAGI